jgi:tetratricopeptide (TPR) repeat protein/DNA-binding XRE family transcriptional regulator
MSEVHTHPSTQDGPEQIRRATPGRRGRRRGVEIRPGSAKQARLEAGLSLGQVAGGEISRTAIYFVETGKAKPSIETLKLIAARTGRPLDYFLSKPSTMEPRSTAGTAEIERLITTGDPAGALGTAEVLLGAESDPELVARIRFLMATAHLRLAQPVPARRLASRARAYFEQAGDLLMTAECLGSEASAAYLMQDPGALSLAEGALATCRGLNPPPPITEARLLAILGSVHATNKDWHHAIEAYEQAIAAGDVVQDLRRLSIMHSDLSLAYQELGQLNEAARHAHRALGLHETLSDRISLARSENNLGLLLMRRGDIADAEGHLVRALKLFEEAGVEPQRANILLSLCEFHLLRDDLEAAERRAREALEWARRASEPANLGESHVWLGRIAVARDDHGTVDTEFQSAFELLEKAQAGERLSRAHVLYAEILEARGDIGGAVRHLKQALAARPSQRAVDSRAAIA